MANNSNHTLAQKATVPLTDAEVASIQAPTLVLRGSDDPIFPTEHARTTCARLPHAQLHVIDRMGHALDPAFFEEIAMALTRFLDRPEGLRR